MLDSTLAVVLCSGIPMNANAIPLQLQLPAKYFTSFSFGFGPGGASMARRVEAVRSRASGALSRLRCVHLEWIDPPFCGGHWNPELVEIAGGIDPVGRKGAPSVRIPWSRIVDARPEILVLACCGYEVERTVARFAELVRPLLAGAVGR